VQTEWVAARIEGPTCLVWVSSEGDQDAGTPLGAFAAPGVFTAALHRALFADRFDAAVHSLKDLPAGEEEGLHLAAVPAREDPRDALVSRSGLGLLALPAGARVGTGSPRRRAEVLRARPDLLVEGVRGNVDTRLKHVETGRLDAVVLAVAGLRRLGLEGRITEVLEPATCLPAAGQGALGLVVRRGDAETEERLRPLASPAAAAATAAERSALHALGAGCHAPVGALADAAGGRVRLVVRVLAKDGRLVIEETGEGTLAAAADVGREVAGRLLARGAGPLVAPA
jgi:hydroxymethylbilane synthase